MSNESPEPNPPFVNKAAVVLIILTCLAIVLVPTIVAYIPIEHSKWIIAEARNSLRKAKDKDHDQVKRAKELLVKAEQINPNIIRSVDYIRLYQEVYDQNFEELAALIIKLNRDYQAALLLQLSEDMIKSKNFTELIRLIDRVMPEVNNRPNEVNNVYAYVAALSDSNLEAAEKAINRVFETSVAEDIPALLDTKAWVYHKQDRNDEALPLMQKAMQLNQNQFNIPLELSRWVTIQRIQLSDGAASLSTAELQELKSYFDAIQQTDPLLKIAPDNLLASLQAISNINLESKNSSDIAKDNDVSSADSSDQSTAEASTNQDKDTASQQYHEILGSLKKPTAPSKVSASIKADADALLNMLAVYRYHRSEIIRGVGFTEIADYEFEIIKSLGIEDPHDLR